MLSKYDKENQCSRKNQNTSETFWRFGEFQVFLTAASTKKMT